METDQIIDSWIQKLDMAFQPYVNFVDTVTTQLEAIELQAILTPPPEVQVVVRTEVVSVSTPTAEPARPEAVIKVKKVLSEKRVLLVDDAEINRVLMSHYFKGLPVKLDFASSAAHALQKCSVTQFDLIVVDDELQNPTSSEIARNLREAGTQAMLVALSNHGEAAHEASPEFSSVLKRGLARELFIERLKSFLWAA